MVILDPLRASCLLAYEFSIIAIKKLPNILFLGLFSIYRPLLDVMPLCYIHRSDYCIPKVWGAASEGFTRIYSGFYVVLCTWKLCQWPSSWHLSCLKQGSKRNKMFLSLFSLNKYLCNTAGIRNSTALLRQCGKTLGSVVSLFLQGGDDVRTRCLNLIAKQRLC